MDLKKSQALLKKINALHESATAFDGKISKMERDLLLHYLREMYEEIITPQYEAEQLRRPISSNGVGSPAPKVQYAERQVAVKEKIAVPAIKPQPELVAIREESKVPEPVHYAEVPEVREKEKKQKEPKKVKIDEGLIALFEINDANDLGSRFSQLPISDIGKSMGINDKILTINDLFNGDQNLFNSVVNDLNRLSSFDKAQNYLVSGIATKNDWSNSKRKGKAEVFIKLIRRRYL